MEHRHSASAGESQLSIFIQKIQRSHLRRIAALRAKSPDKSATPASRARRAPFQENRHFCTQDKQSTSAHVIQPNKKLPPQSPLYKNPRPIHPPPLSAQLLDGNHVILPSPNPHRSRRVK